MTLEPHSGEEALLTYESPHDTFDFNKHANYLHKNAGVGVYAHGRIHQDVGGMIHVSDLIHKRGFLSTDDILLMEEQALTDPLVVPSRLGDIVTMEVLPTMNTASGEGELIAYYRKGVVAFNTYEAPRETRHDGDGKLLQQGWDMKRLIRHLLNTVGAVSRYAVSLLPRDHFFRSAYGLHFLKIVIGEETLNSENTNVISQNVSPLLDADKELSGAATGFWVEGHRMLATTGLVFDEKYSSSSYGRGFVSWNQAVTYTEAGTPLPAWEGLWVVDKGVEGIHRFVENGFIASDRDRNLFKATFSEGGSDVRDTETPIEWSMETGQFAPATLDAKGSISGGTFEATFSDSSHVVSIYIRTDVASAWKLWRRFKPCDKIKTPDTKVRMIEDIGKPPLSHRECTWFQLKVEGYGDLDDPLFLLDFNKTIGKAGKSGCAVISELENDYFSYNNL